MRKRQYNYNCNDTLVSIICCKYIPNNSTLAKINKSEKSHLANVFKILPNVKISFRVHDSYIYNIYQSQQQ